MNTGEKIKYLRLLNNMMQAELGKKIGVTKATISKYETSKVVNIKKDTLRKLANAFGVDVTKLYDDSEEQQPRKETTLASRVNEALSLRHMSASELASLAGIDYSVLQSYMSSKCKPKLDTVRKLSRALEVNEMWLYGYDENFSLIDSIIQPSDDDFLILLRKMTPEQRKIAYDYLLWHFGNHDSFFSENSKKDIDR